MHRSHPNLLHIFTQACIPISQSSSLLPSHCFPASLPGFHYFIISLFPFLWKTTNQSMQKTVLKTSKTSGLDKVFCRGNEGLRCPCPAPACHVWPLHCSVKMRNKLNINYSKEQHDWPNAEEGSGEFVEFADADCSSTTQYECNTCHFWAGVCHTQHFNINEKMSCWS